ncbi:unnamed protein product, partial [marine sediment metagenome]
NIFTGIINGIDYSVWNPVIDAYIPANYSHNNLSVKLENKKLLVKRFNLPYKENIPVIGMISRLVDQKGFDLLEEIIEHLLKMDLQLIILGSGASKYHKIFTKISKKYPDNIGIRLKFDEKLAHLIEAGSDMFLMPSKYEPCGLNQMFSLKYGTVPVVRKTGGLADTITEFDPESGEGNGFVFEKYASEQLLDAIKRAVKLYGNPRIWKKIMKNGMKQDFSWKASAKQYYKVYEKILKR